MHSRRLSIFHMDVTELVIPTVSDRDLVCGSQEEVEGVLEASPCTDGNRSPLIHACWWE